MDPRVCPRCHFENSPRSGRCVLCQAPLAPPVDTTRRPPPPRAGRRGMPPPLSGPQPRTRGPSGRTSGQRPRAAARSGQRPRGGPRPGSARQGQGARSGQGPRPGQGRRAPSERSRAAPRSQSGRPPRAAGRQRPPSERNPRSPEPEPDTRKVAHQALAGPVADLRSRHAAEERQRVIDLASSIHVNPDALEPETRRHGPRSDELDTRDFSRADMPQFPPNAEPDTVAHDDDSISAMVEPDTVKSSGEVDDEAPTSWAPQVQAEDNGSILSDLPTLTYAGGSPPATRETRSGADTVSFPAPVDASPSRPFRWPFVVALALVVIVSGVTQQQRAASEERYRIERVAGEVARIMTSSPLPLRNEANRARELRLDLDALQESGAESPALDEARAGLRSLEGLLALINDDPRGARRALADPVLKRHERYHQTLAASVAATTSGADPALLQEVLEAGFVRPELQAWRARAHLSHLDPTSPQDAEEVLAELEQLASVATLDSQAQIQRLSALSTLGRWALAREELARLDSPPAGLRDRIVLGELAEVVAGDPARAQAWLDVHGVPPQVEPDALRALGQRPLREAHARLRRFMDADREPSQSEQGELLLRLQIAYQLGWRPLPRQILDDLGAVLDGALQRRQRLPGPCCLALATLGTPEERSRVLVAVARRLEETRTASGRLPLQSLQATILRARPGKTPSAEALLAPLPAGSRLELRRARVAALLELGRARKALLEVQAALKRHPGDASLEALRARAVEKLR